MRQLLVALTGHCNLHCDYCYRAPGSQQGIKWDSLRAAIDIALREIPPQADLLFSGGEPLLEFDQLQAAVEYAEAHCPSGKHIQYGIATNGLLISSEVADFLRKYDFFVQLSFDGVEAAQDCRGKGTFARLDRLLSGLSIGYPELWQKKVRVAMTVSPHTVRHMADSVEYFLGKDVRKLAIAPDLAAQPEWEIDDFEEMEYQAAKINELCRSHLVKTGRVPVLLFRKSSPRPSLDRFNPQSCCGLSGESIAVDADGEVYFCPLFAKSCRAQHPTAMMNDTAAFDLGNIIDPQFARHRTAAGRAASRALPRDSRSHRHSPYERCIACRFSPDCRVCPISIWSRPGDPDPYRVPGFICAFNRAMLKQRETFPCEPNPLMDMLTPDGPDPIEPLEAWLRQQERCERS